jgi:choline dehydrogenase
LAAVVRSASLEVDFVIAGGGTAGCVLAHRLSENGRHRVLLLEAGPRDAYPWIHIPIGYAKTMFHPTYNWRFSTEPEPEMNGREIYWPRGRTLGGSSSINGLIYVRGHRDDYDHWAALGNRGWGYDDVLPYFRKLEHNVRGESEWHGAAGPQWASDISTRHELVEALIAAGEELGIPRNADFNGASQEGVGYYQLTTRHGLRCSTAAGYLRQARHRANLTVLTNAHVTRIVVEGRRATGVVFRQGDREATVAAHREVIVAAGALQSPQLLQLSGIGPPSLLQSFRIPVIHRLDGVGENLQDHLQVRTIFRCTKPITTNDTLKSWWRTLAMGARYALTRDGPMAVGINQGGVFARTDPSLARPDVQFHLATLSSDMAGSPVHEFSGFTLSVCQLQPESRGFVRVKSSDPLAAPAMQPRYLSTERDRAMTVAGLRLSRKLAATRALAPYVAAEYMPGPAATTDADLLEFARNKGATIFHPAGTCKMGPQGDTAAVVDPELRVHGMDHLRVVDCSVMPTLVSGNTSAPVIMIAEKASDMILADAR